MTSLPRGLHGFGLRTSHYDELLGSSSIDATCAEIISENVVGRGGRPLALIEHVRSQMPVFLHGVSLSIGGMDPLAVDHLRAIRELADQIDCPLVSDHLCFGTHGGHFGHDLWPLPYTEEALDHVAARVRQAQDILGRRLLIENVSSYISYRASTMTEWDFLAALCERADCLLLFDVNNVVVSAFNHGFSEDDYLAGIPAHRVAQLHLAGHSDQGTHLFDDHSSPVPERVWNLYRKTVQKMGDVPAIIEWDGNVPELERLVDESRRARREEQAALAEAP
ncbi:MAG: DUF692 domain-containing protein [Polyangiaceae bacterium]|jgi:hypothetical protein|nr:DUF692 domain-containing protein [Polyangiaceae bacterium]